MAPTQSMANRAADRQLLVEKMLLLGQRIDQEHTGPARLELLRQQATLSDELEALRSPRR
jgi:hypothetical protein